MLNMKPNFTIRIWKDSSLVGRTIRDISKKFNVIIIKVARGSEATNPSGDLTINEADYITYKGEDKACLELLKNSAQIKK